MKFHTQAVAAALLSTTLSKVLASDSCDTRGDYGCGTGQGVQPWWTEDCQPYDCCCDTFGVHTPDTACANFQNAPKGCSSCIGKDSCKDVSPGSVLVGDNSCHGAESCREATHNPMALTSTVFWQNSCTGVQSCKQVSQVIIGSGSCDNLRSCYRMRETTVGENSCGGSNACEYLFSSTVGDNSCQGGIEGLDLSICAGWEGNTKYGAHLKIGNRACNGYVGADTGEYGVCTYCENNTEVPDDSCNDITGNDVVYLDHWGYTCVYCVVSNIRTTKRATIPSHHFQPHNLFFVSFATLKV